MLDKKLGKYSSESDLVYFPNLYKYDRDGIETWTMSQMQKLPSREAVTRILFVWQIFMKFTCIIRDENISQILPEEFYRVSVHPPFPPLPRKADNVFFCQKTSH